MARGPGHGGARPAITVISGGQTGVDRAALDAALEAGIPCGGWCPAGRRAEDGTIPSRYPLKETASADFAARTRRNVEDADGTLIVAKGAPDDGTRLAEAHARALGRPVLTADLGRGREELIESIRVWIGAERIVRLNIAGPRESTAPGVYAEALDLFGALFSGPRPRS